MALATAQSKPAWKGIRQVLTPPGRAVAETGKAVPALTFSNPRLVPGCAHKDLGNDLHQTSPAAWEGRIRALALLSQQLRLLIQDPPQDSYGRSIGRIDAKI